MKSLKPTYFLNLFAESMGLKALLKNEKSNKLATKCNIGRKQK